MKYRYTVVAGAALAVLAAFILGTVPAGQTYLVLSDDESGQVLLRHPVCQGHEFSISFIHSVNLSPVREIYVIRSRSIVLTALEFETFGAGIPTQLEPGQTLVRLPGGGMRMEGLDRNLGQLRYLVPHGTDIALIVGERQVPLDSLAAPGQTVRFSVFQRGFRPMGREPVFIAQNDRPGGDFPTARRRFFLKYTKYSCENSSCSAKKSLAAAAFLAYEHRF